MFLIHQQPKCFSYGPLHRLFSSQPTHCTALICNNTLLRHGVYKIKLVIYSLPRHFLAIASSLLMTMSISLAPLLTANFISSNRTSRDVWPAGKPVATAMTYFIHILYILIHTHVIDIYKLLPTWSYRDVSTQILQSFISICYSGWIDTHRSSCKRAMGNIQRFHEIFRKRMSCFSTQSFSIRRTVITYELIQIFYYK